MKRSWSMRRWIAVSFVAVTVLVMAVFITTAARAQMDQAEGSSSVDGANTRWAFLSAAIATGFGCLGAGIAVAYVGAAAVGAVGEKPEVAGRTLIFVGLAEGIAIYGLIIAIMILGKV